MREQLQATLGAAYSLERELGGGGMSRVFVAEETALRRKVVVKVLPVELTGGVNVERFNREILLAAQLQHPHIVPVLTAGETQGLPYYTMPFVDGESLRALLARAGALPITDAVGFLRDVAKALAYAHERGIVHRDIKPDNVLITGGSATVTDFGIAKAISASRTAGTGATLTQVGTSIGTPTYMSPEQAAGDPGADHRADIYSFGCLAYELLAGQPPFTDKTPRKLLAAHMGEKPRPITELRPDTPAALADVVMRCLEKQEDDRPQRASDLVHVLETVTSSGSGAAMPAILLGGPAMFRKALVIYAVAFGAVAILAKAAIVGIGLPDWVFPGALIVMALGLPLVLWTGYVQRVTRHAITMTPTYTPGGTPSLTHGTMATMALKAAPHVSWHLTARRGLYGLGAFTALIALFMTLRAFGIGPFGSLLAAGKLGRAEPILLTDFRTSNVDSTLGRVVSDAVRAGLSGSTAFTLTPPATVAAALSRMQRSPGARVDSAVARELAVREGIKAIVDGDVTGVPGGYIVSIRLVRADSGIELASFRETGDGPRGLIDAADRLARALRSRAGESLRAVNATPPLSQATTSSLDALRKYSEGVRANTIGDSRAVTLAREAVAIDSTFASAWSTLGAYLSNYGGKRSAVDSAITLAYRYRDRLPAHERDLVVARYYGMGPGRDRAKSIAAYETIAQRDSGTSLVNLGEQLRSRREFARVESLNLAHVMRAPKNGSALGNAVEMQLNQGKLKEAAATAVRLRAVSEFYGTTRQVSVLFAQGDEKALRALVDSQLRLTTDQQTRAYSIGDAASLALRDGRLRDAAAFLREIFAADVANRRIDSIFTITLEAAVRGPSPVITARLDAAIASVPFRELPMVDRPYFAAATALARTGSAEKARAMVARYRAEVTDTSIRRWQQADLHEALGEIALAERKPQEALVEFRKGDVGYDGFPANECAPCLPFNLARVFDAAGQVDSAAVMYERYLSTPYWDKIAPDLDPVRVPAIRERLGQIYEARGNAEKAAENYRAFIELWKNADPELQPRVAEARRRLAKLTPVEKGR
jgi:tetratricopeptide (TPR) repeat protein